MAIDTGNTDMPVVRNLAGFDMNSGNALERLVFGNRLAILVIGVVISVFLAIQALGIRVNASYESMLPQSHSYMQNYMTHRADLGSLGNTIRVVVENRTGDIFDPAYLEILRKVTDEIMITKGVNRAWVKSLWLPTVRWTDITEDGFAGGTVMPDGYDGSPAMLDKLRTNVQRANLVGNLVSTDMKSAMIVVPLLDHDPETGLPLNYTELSRHGEQVIRAMQTDEVRIHAIGFSVLVGQLIDGLYQVMAFFAVAVAITAVIIYWYSRCIRSTVLLVVVSVVSVLWLLGIIALLGHALDPYSILVPFLIFAIGISHGAQKMNGVAQDIARGTHHYVAARYTFRRLFLAGLTALLVNVFGFAVLMVVDIPVIREMALITSIGVAVLIPTKLIGIPIMLSYIGVNPKAAVRRMERDADTERAHSGLLRFVHFARPRWAVTMVALAALAAAGCWWISLDLKVGDLDAGAPELRANSLYNRDAAFINDHFGLSSDQFAVIVKTPANGGQRYDTLIEMQRLGTLLAQDPDVQAVHSVAEDVPFVNMGQFEGNPKWLTIPRSSNAGVAVYTLYTQKGLELQNADYSTMPLIAYLTNHKAETLDRLLAKVEAFAALHDRPELRFLPIAGSAGVEAVTNIVVRKAHVQMLLLLYASVIVLCYITFRNWRAVLIALIPLLITAVIAEAIMVLAGIGLKVATLPVHALGVGVGVDYAIYLLSIQLARQRQGEMLEHAYAASLRFTGRVVALIGFTMAAGVITWAWSPIKFQADMGILLAFMFVWNMLGALVLIPALSRFLLPHVQRGADAGYSGDTAAVAQA